MSQLCKNLGKCGTQCGTGAVVLYTVHRHRYIVCGYDTKFRYFNCKDWRMKQSDKFNGDNGDDVTSKWNHHAAMCRACIDHLLRADEHELCDMYNYYYYY